MKHIALALIACAGLGLAARQPVLPNGSRSSEPVRPALNSEAGPVETPMANDNTTNVIVPLVEKLLPQPAKVQVPKPTIADGQLSPRGEWRWSQAQGAWVPVAKPGPRWVENGHSATIEHLVRDHGYRRADLTKLTQYQLDTLHSNSHNSARARRVSAPTYSACPTGRCPRR